MRKKITFLPYDFDTALGTNNEGALVFGYGLEDTDQTEGGADVYNGQQSVLWRNVRAAFGPELAAMYQRLRSTGALSFGRAEAMFEEHQRTWGEAVFNEDSYEKYLVPLISEGNAAYLAMLQGSKASQRRWWLYNRLRYLDSKYNAGDALADFVQLRGYARADITVTPYADVYPSVRYGSYLVQERGRRNLPTTLPCPLSNVNDTEIIIFSASQLASVGDLSGLKAGFADFSMAARLQAVKVGDADPAYMNGNLRELHLGSNPLLREVDARNCHALGTGDQKSVDLSGCPNIERVYLDGTSVAGVDLPVGGVLRSLHLPGTVTNLTVRNHPLLSDLVIPALSQVTTLWLEGTALDGKAILGGIPAGARVRLAGIHWEAADAEEVTGLYDTLDGMRGLDEHGGNMDRAQVSGTIHVPSITGEDLAALSARYPYVTIEADHTLSYLTYMTWDGGETLKVVACNDGVPQEAAPAGPERAATERVRYAFAGWSDAEDAESGTAGYDEGVLTDRTVYAAYTRTALTYLTYMGQDGQALLGTVTCAAGVPEGDAPEAPAKGDTAQYAYTFSGWSLQPGAETATEGAEANVTEDRQVYAAYAKAVRTYTVTWLNSDGAVLETDTSVPYSTTPRYDGETPQNPEAGGSPFQGWSPPVSPVTCDAAYTASYVALHTVRFWNGGTLLQTVEDVPSGGTASYTGETPVKPGVEDPSGWAFIGWSPQPSDIRSDTDCQAQFQEETGVPTARTADGAYGVEWDYSRANASLSRKGLATGFSDPVVYSPYVERTCSSPFDGIEPWVSMKRYCLVDGAWVGDDDPAFDESQHDTMVFIPEFYYTAFKDEANSKWLWAVSPTPVEGFSKHPGSGRYIGRFHTSGDSSGVFSKAGVVPLTNTSQTSFRNYSAAKGEGWGMMDIAAWSAVQLLYLVEFAHFDAILKLGKGCAGYTNFPLPSGATGSCGYHTVSEPLSDIGHNCYRWIEDPFSNCRDWLDGFVGSTSETYAAANDSYEGGAADLQALGIPLPATGKIVTGFGYSAKAPWAFIPDTVSDSQGSNEYTTDGVRSDAAECPASVGGTSEATVDNSGGMFSLWANSGASTKNTYIGSRLQKRA